MQPFRWDPAKNDQLKRERNISFERVVLHIEQGDLLDILEHPELEKYPDQRLLIVQIEGYVYVVPCIEEEDSVFLKTVFPSRKLTKQYLQKGGKNG